MWNLLISVKVVCVCGKPASPQIRWEPLCYSNFSVPHNLQNLFCLFHCSHAMFLGYRNFWPVLGGFTFVFHIGSRDQFIRVSPPCSLWVTFDSSNKTKSRVVPLLLPARSNKARLPVANLHQTQRILPKCLGRGTSNLQQCHVPRPNNTTGAWGYTSCANLTTSTESKRA